MRSEGQSTSAFSTEGQEMLLNFTSFMHKLNFALKLFQCKAVNQSLMQFWSANLPCI